MPIRARFCVIIAGHAVALACSTTLAVIAYTRGSAYWGGWLVSINLGLAMLNLAGLCVMVYLWRRLRAFQARRPYGL